MKYYGISFYDMYGDDWMAELLFPTKDQAVYYAQGKETFDPEIMGYNIKKFKVFKEHIQD